MRARRLQDGEAAAAGELTVTATDGPVNGIRLAVKPDGHRVCEGTGKLLEATATAKAGSPCTCVLKSIDAEFHGATYEIDYRTPQQRLEDQIAAVTARIAGLRVKAFEDIERYQQGIREAREAGAKAASELEDTEPLLREAEDQMATATKLLAEARNSLREAEAGERLQAQLLRRVREQRETAGSIRATNEASIKALDAEVLRAKAKWESKIKDAEAVLAELQARLASGC